MSSSKNLEFEKTSFLSKSNSAFIERMYLKFINKDTDLPESWKDYFEGIGDELNIIAKEINGPSWGPSKNKIDIDELQKKIEQEDKNLFNNNDPYNWMQKALNSPKSGIVNPELQENWKKQMEMYFEYIMDKREEYKYDYVSTTRGYDYR